MLVIVKGFLDFRYVAREVSQRHRLARNRDDQAIDNFHGFHRASEPFRRRGADIAAQFFHGQQYGGAAHHRGAGMIGSEAFAYIGR